MNKQILIAGLLGAASANAVPTPCENAFVAKATEAEAQAVADAKIVNDLVTSKAKALSDAEAARAPVAAVLLSRTEAKAALQTAYDTANTAWSTRTDTRTAALKEQTDQGALVTSTNSALVTAEGLVTTQKLVVANLQDLYDELVKAIVDDEAAIVLLETAVTTATTAETTAKTAQTAAIKAFNDAQALRSSVSGSIDNTYNDDGTVLVAQAVSADVALRSATDGDTALLAAAATDIQTKSGAYTTALGLAAIMTPQSAYSAAQLASDKATAILASVTAGCNGICSSSTLANDPTLAQKVAATTVTTATNSSSRTLTQETTAQKALYDTQTGLIGDLSDTWKDAVVNRKAIEVRDNLVGTSLASGGTLFDARTAANDAVTNGSTGKTFLKTTAASALSSSTINTNLAANKLKRDNLNVELTAQTNALTPLVSDVTVKTYLASIPIAALATANANVALAGTAEIAAFLAIKNAAATSLATAEAAVVYAQANLTVEDGRVKLVQDAVTANADAITAANLAVTQWGVNKASAIAACKGAGYERAQEALKKQNAETISNTGKADAIKKAYNAKAAFATGGGANTPCTQVTDVDGVVTRAVCSEGFCCGAAQKIERNGDKLAVETCQSNTGVRSYTYYPPLAAGATVEPTPETWRFQCISGATQLAAAATAALVAATML